MSKAILLVDSPEAISDFKKSSFNSKYYFECISNIAFPFSVDYMHTILNNYSCLVADPKSGVLPPNEFRTFCGLLQEHIPVIIRTESSIHCLGHNYILGCDFDASVNKSNSVDELCETIDNFVE